MTTRTEVDWPRWKLVFTELYKDQNKPLPEVMRIMDQNYGVKASIKMYKNKIKEWGITKYLKAEQAQQIVDADGDGSLAGFEDITLKLRAQKSLKRKRAREKAQTQASARQTQSITPDLYEEPESYSRDNLVSPTSAGVYSASIAGSSWPRPHSSRSVLSASPPLSEAAKNFLINLRIWTHDAYMSRVWDLKSSSQHHSGRKASRTWASDLTAGTTLYKKGRKDLAWKYWTLAVASFENPDLLNTWYWETPIRLLFEMGRLVHNGHAALAASLLRCIKDWAEKSFDPSDSRRTLYCVFGQLDPHELRVLYDYAAKSLYQGFAQRLDKKHPLLYEIRLNRALDLLWYDNQADLSEWVPSIEEVDESCGPHNQYSVYFLLLEAYRLVATEEHDRAEEVCDQVVKRLQAMEDENKVTIDPWRVGLAYRRLGRVQQEKNRYEEAKLSFNKALLYVSSDENKKSGSTQIEICQDLEQMARELNELEDAALWHQKLERLEKQAAEQEEEELKRLEAVGEPPELGNGGDGNEFEAMQTFTHYMLPQYAGFEPEVKRVKLDADGGGSASPGSPPGPFDAFPCTGTFPPPGLWQADASRPATTRPHTSGTGRTGT